MKIELGFDVWWRVGGGFWGREVEREGEEMKRYGIGIEDYVDR